MNDNNDLVGRIAGMAMTKITGMSHSTGVYFKVVELVGGDEVKATCTNPNLPKMERTFPVATVRKQLQLEHIQGQLAPMEGEALDYTAKCYETERQEGESDDHLKARLTAIGLGPNRLN